MISFIDSSEISTISESEIGKNPTYLRLSPFLYIGNSEGYTASNYDPYDEWTVKNLKISVASAKNDPILRLDTIDLYDKFDHEVSEISKFDNTIIQTISKSCPVKFRRIHFLASKNGEGGEYQGIFLVGKAIPVNQTATEYEQESEAEEWTPGYAKAEGDYKDRLVLGGATWSKKVRDFYGALVKDFSEESIEGEYIKISTVAGSDISMSERVSFSNEEPQENASALFYKVAKKVDEKYVLTSDTCGDIRIPLPLGGKQYQPLVQGTKDKPNTIMFDALRATDNCEE